MLCEGECLLQGVCELVLQPLHLVPQLGGLPQGDWSGHSQDTTRPHAAAGPQGHRVTGSQSHWQRVLRAARGRRALQEEAQPGHTSSLSQGSSSSADASSSAAYACMRGRGVGMRQARGTSRSTWRGLSRLWTWAGGRSLDGECGGTGSMAGQSLAHCTRGHAPGACETEPGREGWELVTISLFFIRPTPLPLNELSIKLLHEGTSHTMPPWGTVLMSLTNWLPPHHTRLQPPWAQRAVGT